MSNFKTATKISERFKENKKFEKINCFELWARYYERFISVSLQLRLQIKYNQEHHEYDKFINVSKAMSAIKNFLNNNLKLLAIFHRHTIQNHILNVS